MTFDAREAVQSVDPDDYPPYEFTGLDGKKYTLPNALTLTFRQAERLEEDPGGVISEISPDAFEALADLPLHAWVAFGKSWQEHGGDLGKSPSPSRQIRRAAKASKRTSQSAAST